MSPGPPTEAWKRAVELVGPGEEILAVYTISDENRRSMTNAMFICPPCLLCCKPCCAPAYEAMLASTIYIVTDRYLYRQVDSKNRTFSTGNNSGQCLLSDISSIGTDRPPAVFGMNPYPMNVVMIGLPLGNVLADTGPSMGDGSNRMTMPTQMRMLVDEPEEVMRLIRAAKEKADANRFGGGGGPVPVVMGADAHADETALDKIKKLSELRDAGAISDASFKAKKDELMRQV